MTSDDPNRRFKYLLQHGQTGFSVAFDMPILMGIDAHDSRAHGEVGHCGVAISSLADMDRLFADIPLDQVTTSMTINGRAAVIFAMYLAVAEKRGSSVERLGGTLQNDILKEYIVRKNGFSHLNPHCGSSPTLWPTVRNRPLNGIRSAPVGKDLRLAKAVEPRETCGVTGR
jgi:methylmalonyl-CoA mutase, N-terminal domain